MPAISVLYEPIVDDLEKVCAIFDDELFSDLPALNDLCSYIRQYRGKMLRPALVLLSARACGKVTAEHLTLAAVVELVHMATLVHDDVLDEAELRRKVPTVWRQEGNETAVLLGDYLISHAFHLCSSLESQFASRTIGATTNTVCEGEMQQVFHRGNIDLSREQYLQIITQKTAALMGACCLLGAHFADADKTVVRTFEQYGLNLGIAFQITDDILDIIGVEKNMGKTLGRDLEKRKLTLPLIHGLSKAEAPVRQRLCELLAAEQQDREAIQTLLKETGSIVYACDTARRYIESAIKLLDKLPASDARESLQSMAGLILERQQ